MSRPGYLRLRHGGLVGSDLTFTLGDELVLRSSIIDTGQSFWVWAEAVGGFGGAAGEEVATDEGEVGEKFADFGVGEDEGKNGA